MSKHIDIGGVSAANSITFFGNRFSSKIDFAKHKIIIQKMPIGRDEKILSFFRKLPFIRGPVSFFYTLFQVIYPWIKKVVIPYLRKEWANILLCVVIAAVLVNIILVPTPTITEPITFSMAGNVLWPISFYAGFAILLYAFIKPVAGNHSIEHKAIAAYESKKGLGVRNILQQPKEHRRCGGVFATWLIFFLIFEKLFPVLVGWGFTLLQISLAYEFSLLARRGDWLGGFFYAPGFYFQKYITTSKRYKFNNVLMARQAIKALLKVEGATYGRKK